YVTVKSSIDERFDVQLRAVGLKSDSNGNVWRVRAYCLLYQRQLPTAISPTRKRNTPGPNFAEACRKSSTSSSPSIVSPLGEIARNRPQCSVSKQRPYCS